MSGVFYKKNRCKIISTTPDMGKTRWGCPELIRFEHGLEKLDSWDDYLRVDAARLKL